MATFGKISTNSLCVSFPSFTNEDLTSLYSKYGNGEKINYRQINLENIPEVDSQMILTDAHEFDHFYQLVSSSVGINLFRIYNTLIADVGWISNEFNKAELKIDNTGKDLVNWLKKTGIKKLNSRLQTLGKDNKIITYIRVEIIPGLEALQKLILILTSISVPKELKSITVNDFCDLLNQAYSYLRKRADLDIEYGNKYSWKDKGFKWGSKLPSNHKVFTQAGTFLSYSNILECLAYIHEYRIIKIGGSSKNFINKWLKERVPTKYRDLLIPLLQVYDPDGARGFLLSYLNSRIDIASGNPKEKNEVILIEEEWPFFLYLGVNNPDEFHLKRLNNGINGCKAILKRRKLFGEKSNWRNPANNLAMKNLSFTSFFNRLEKYFLTAIKRKHDHLIKLKKGKKSYINLNDLVMNIEYKDTFTFNRLTKKINHKDALKELTNLWISVFHPVLAQVALRIFAGEPIEDPFYKINKLEKIYSFMLKENMNHKTLATYIDSFKPFFSRDCFEYIFSGFELSWIKKVSS